MKFEYELKYDLVNEELTLKVTKMIDRMRGEGEIKTFTIYGDTWSIRSYAYTQLDIDFKKIYLPGPTTNEGDYEATITCEKKFALAIAKALKEFQAWAEQEYTEFEDMTFEELCKAKDINEETAKLIKQKVAKEVFDDLKDNAVTKVIYKGNLVWAAENSLNDIRRKYGVKEEK